MKLLTEDLFLQQLYGIKETCMKYSKSINFLQSNAGFTHSIIADAFKKFVCKLAYNFSFIILFTNVNAWVLFSISESH